MDLERIVAELRSESDRIGRAIAALLEGSDVIRRGRRPKPAPKAKSVGGYWKNMSKEARSAEMRRRAKVRVKNRKKGR